MSATNQGNVRFSYKKYYSFRNRIINNFRGRLRADMRIDSVSRALFYGDIQPALVTSLSPLTIAAYSDEIDSVLMLRFPDEFVDMFNLYLGMRLTTSNIYFRGMAFPEDILVGKNFCRNYTDFLPIVQLFLGKNDEKIKANAEMFDEKVWARVAEQAAKYTAKRPNLYRDGLYYFKK